MPFSLHHLSSAWYALTNLFSNIPCVSPKWRRRGFRLILVNALANLVIFPIAFLPLRVETRGKLSLVQLLMMYILPPLSIIGHSVLRVFNPDWWIHIVDILYSLIELGCLFVLLSLPFRLDYYHIIWSSPGTDTLHSLSTIALTLFYTFQCAGTLWDIVFDKEIELFNSSSFCPDKSHDKRWAFIFGVTPWQNRFKSEGHWMQWSRGFIAICCLIFVGLLAFYSLVVQPAYMLSTFHSTLYKTYWSPALNALNTTMNVMLVLPGEYPHVPSLQEIMNITVSGQQV